MSCHGSRADTGFSGIGFWVGVMGGEGYRWTGKGERENKEEETKGGRDERRKGVRGANGFVSIR